MTLKEIISILSERSVYRQTIALSGLLFSNNNKEDIKKYQINSFNSVWKDAYVNIPFYRKYKEENGLPDEIRGLEELGNWPIITKQQLMKNPEDLLRSIPPDSYSITSGSTGIPLRIPVKYGLSTQPNMWVGRAANGILPHSKTFIIWGHHHLHGRGIKRIINTFVRNVKDWVLNYKRISAYDTSLSAMRSAYNKYNKFAPEFVIGYSSSILAFVRCNAGLKLTTPPPKAVLCTAGPLSEAEKEEVRKYFNAPICMEYGSMECGVMGYTVDDASYYNVFWNTHILQGNIDENNKVRNIVTLISKKYFPLIRYDIGDWLDLDDEESLDDIMRIKKVAGRPTDIVKLEDGVSFSAMLIEACVEHLEGIIAHQLIVDGNQLVINIIGLNRYNDVDLNSVRSKLNHVVPALSKEKVDIIQVDELVKAKSGKTPLVIRK